MKKIKLPYTIWLKQNMQNKKSKTSAVNLHYFSIFEILKKKQHTEQ